MKSILSILIVSLFTAIAVPSFAQTNSTTLEQVGNTVKSTVATNINQVLIEMLSGAKDAGKEIYGASKEAIHTSVNFIGEQAPDVIKQFLMWRFFRAVTWAGIFTFVAAGVCLFFSNKLKKYQTKANTGSRYSDNPSEHEVTTFFKWLLAVVACIFIIFGVGTNAFEMVKIKVAPKVYIIEYVVDTVKSYEHSNNNR